MLSWPSTWLVAVPHAPRLSVSVCVCVRVRMLRGACLRRCGWRRDAAVLVYRADLCVACLSSSSKTINISARLSLDGGAEARR